MTLQNSSRHRLPTILAFFLSAAACLAASASDQPANEETSTTVKFADLNLDTDAGRRELLTRISKAADRVCSENTRSLASLGTTAVWVSCYRHTVAATVAKFHDAEVSALFAATSYPNTR